MARQPARREENRVGPQRIGHRPRVRREPAARREREAFLLLRRDRDRRIIEIAARFHFDEDDRAAAPRDDVDFAAMRAKIARENLIEARP